MTDQRNDAELPLGETDATGQPTGTEQVQPPQQAPMDDAAAGPTGDADAEATDIDDADTDDLFVQGGQ